MKVADSEWSNRLPLETVGSSGFLTCKKKDSRPCEVKLCIRTGIIYDRAVLKAELFHFFIAGARHTQPIHLMSYEDHHLYAFLRCPQ